MSDEELASRLLAGDAQAVDALRGWIRSAFHSYRRRLAAEAEDLEQEILYEVTRAMREGQFEGRSQVRTYVSAYVHHKCIDRLRTRQRWEWVSIEDIELHSRSPSPLDRLSERETVEQALRVLEEVPDSCRELWQMLQEGLRYREMSRRLGISEATLRSRVLRCRRLASKLRLRLSEENLQRNPKSDD